LSASAIEVRELRSSDAAGVATCVRRCYGDGYPKRVLYDEKATALLVERRALRGVVALAAGRLVGHIGFTRPHPGASVVEAGITMVDPEARGSGVMRMLSAELFRVLRRDDVVGFVHFPTTAHAVMQRASLQSGGVETGVLLAYIPAITRDITIGSASAGRLAVTAVFQPIASAPASCMISVPARYAALIGDLIARSSLRRTVTVETAAASGRTTSNVIVDSARALGRIELGDIGADVVTAVDDALGSFDAATIRLFHVDIPLRGAGLDLVVEHLSKRGFVFGAWLPGWARSDVMRLQRIAQLQPAEADPDLVSEHARRLLRSISAEMARSMWPDGLVRESITSQVMDSAPMRSEDPAMEALP
jgi:GNAT superfamily N-acetyltransferase